MHNPFVYPILGFSVKERRRKFREKALTEAEKCKAVGIPTRIPFLKKVLCGIDTEQSSQSNLSAPPPKEFVLKLGLRPLLDPRASMVQVVQWNSAMHQDGIQFVSVAKNPGELIRLEQRNCSTVLEGDLKLTTIVDGDPKINSSPAGAGYYDHIFQIFLKPGIERSMSEVLVHEKEHAIHLSLWGLAGFHHRLFLITLREYLAMLATLFETGVTGIIEHSRIDFFKKLRDKNQREYAAASALFALKLYSLYNLTPGDLDLAMHAYHFPEESEPEILDLHERIRKYAEIEYHKAYSALFGMEKQDICEIIESLPVI